MERGSSCCIILFKSYSTLFVVVVCCVNLRRKKNQVQPDDLAVIIDAEFLLIPPIFFLLFKSFKLIFFYFQVNVTGFGFLLPLERHVISITFGAKFNFQTYRQFGGSYASKFRDSNKNELIFFFFYWDAKNKTKSIDPITSREAGGHRSTVIILFFF